MYQIIANQRKSKIDFGMIKTRLNQGVLFREDLKKFKSFNNKTNDKVKKIKRKARISELKKIVKKYDMIEVVGYSCTGQDSIEVAIQNGIHFINKPSELGYTIAFTSSLTHELYEKEVKTFKKLKTLLKEIFFSCEYYA